MKQITLIRHAKVDIESSKPIHAKALSTWVMGYDTAPIDAKSIPSNKTIHMAQDADIVVTSRLSRAIDSAKVLGVEVYEENKIFNEASIPHMNIPFLKLKPKTWLIVLRVMLLLRLGQKETSLKVSKAQAREASQRLVELSAEHNHIVLVGHGGMNWMIRQELLKIGWKLANKGSHKNWGTTVLKS